MTIANTWVWVDRTSSSIGIRSSNRKTSSQPFEAYLTKYLGLLDCEIYETGDESDNTEYRLKFKLFWLSLNLLLWKSCAKTNARCGDGRAWGWYFMDRRSLILRFGKFYKNFDLPFVSLVFVRHEILSMSRNRIVYVVPCRNVLAEWDKRQEVITQHSASFPYRYELLTGETQDVTATINVERRIWRYKWTPFKHIRESIDVHFSEEVGPERGSWKGGCVGCGYDLKPHETAIQCLRRMERDRRFER